MQYDLQPLNLEETAEYLDFRMAAAGGQAGVFSGAAVEQIYTYSTGIPRKINHAASLALLEGFGRGASHVDGSVIEAVMLELSDVTG